MKEKKKFILCLNCIDGRTHEAIFDYLKRNYPERYIDYITAPGMVRHLSDEKEKFNGFLNEAIEISIKFHNPEAIVIAAHSDCAGNPVEDAKQKQMLKKAKEMISSKYNISVEAVFLENNQNLVNV
ncbi:MAG: hypothetical protein N2440_03965 [Actinobacteria bacterium]|nr:hypothetical protein [Actinomycetota bacterium]